MDLMKHEISHKKYAFFKGGYRVADFNDLSSVLEYGHSIVDNASSTYTWDSISVSIIGSVQSGFLFKKEIEVLTPITWNEVNWALDDSEMYEDED